MHHDRRTQSGSAQADATIARVLRKTQTPQSSDRSARHADCRAPRLQLSVSISVHPWFPLGCSSAREPASHAIICTFSASEPENLSSFDQSLTGYDSWALTIMEQGKYVHPDVLASIRNNPHH